MAIRRIIIRANRVTLTVVNEPFATVISTTNSNQLLEISTQKHNFIYNDYMIITI
jgi:hypothetical protein